MPRDRIASLLRRYVARRATGEPCPEYTRLVDLGGGIEGWLWSDEVTARASGRWRRLRVPGKPWCTVLGPHVEIAHDVELQAHFVTVTEGGWRRLEHHVRRRSSRCLQDWRAAGRRVIDAARAAAEGKPLPGKLSGWPSERGSGARTMPRQR